MSKITNKKKKVLGIIPARGGSKGIPGKNIKNFCGKPLLAHIFDAAKNSGVFDRIIVSTDDEKIAQVAKKCGAEVPFIRPARLAQDKTPTLPVIQHAVNYLKENENYNPDYVMILQPTVPLTQSRHLKEAVELILNKKADTVLSVAEIPESFNPCNAMVLDEGFLKLYNGLPVRQRIPRRQDRPQTFWSIGCIYLFRTDLIFDQKEPSFYGNKILPYILEKECICDINTPEDWDIAAKSYKKLRK